MALMHYGADDSLNRFRNEMNRLFEDVWGRNGSGASRVLGSEWAPAVDICEEQDRFVIHADVPGVNPTEVEITLENGVLTISGQRTIETKEDKGTFHHLERSRGSFMRRFTLPTSVDAEHITARTRDGVLEVTVPKAAEAQPRRITVEG